MGGDSLQQDSVSSKLVQMDSIPPESPRDSLRDSADFSQVTTSSRPFWLGILAWPFENIVQPTFNLLLFPVRPPLTYVIEHKVIERGIRLITLGDHNQVMLYPTFNLKPGTQSSLGITYRHRGILGDVHKDYWVNQYNTYINGDMYFRTKYSRNKLFGTELKGWTSIRLRWDRDASFCVSLYDNECYQYTDSSWEWRNGISNPLIGNWVWEMQVGVDHERYGMPTTDVDTLPTSVDSLNLFNRYDHGFYQQFWQIPLGIQLTYNTKDFGHAPTMGQYLRLQWQYVHVSSYDDPTQLQRVDNGLDHGYYTWDMIYQKYLLIGKKQYFLTRAENKANKRYLKSMNLQKAMDLLGPDQLRETLLERKVLALQFRMRQMWEVDETAGAPISGFSLLSTGMPLRGYERSYDDYNVYALSLEYRWPIVDLVDGVVFDEYGLFGRSWKSPEWDNLRNSWGFGIRVRTPNQFLTRFQIGFHGLDGFIIILTTSAEFK